MTIPFSKPSLEGHERQYMLEALDEAHLSGNGRFTKAAQATLKEKTGAHAALLTHSGTSALELAALTLDIKPGDEIIMPSYTFVSTASAFVLRGGVPVFVDVRSDTINIDETLIEQAITSRTRAIAPVHYAGVGCEMDTICEIAKAKNLTIVEDAAQGLGATYKGKPLGTFGALSALSFHASKNVVSGEGGAMLVNDLALLDRAEIIREKGTDRSRFLRGEVDKYTWVDVGSSYSPSEVIAALLLAQMERADDINARRVALWDRYYDALAPLEAAGGVRRARVPAECRHNGHIFFLIFDDLDLRMKAREALSAHQISSSAHYVPLHSSPGGQRFGRTASDMTVTDAVHDGLLRLPAYAHMTMDEQDRVIETLLSLRA